MPAAPRVQRRTLVRRLLVVLASIVGALVLAELGTRLVLALKGEPFDSEKTRLEMMRLRSAAEDEVPRFDDLPRPDAVENGETPFLNPYFGWEILAGAGWLEGDLKWSKHADYEQTYKILLVGGSVAVMFGHYGVGPMSRLLKQDPRFADKRIHFQCYARGGFKEPQQLGMTNYLLSLGLEFQAVVCIDGFNDVALANDNTWRGANPIQPAITHWGGLTGGALSDRIALDAAAAGRSAQRATSELATGALDWGVHKSAIATHFVLARLNRHAAAAHDALEAFSRRVREIGRERVLRGPPFASDPEAGIRDAVRVWEESSRSLRAICRERGIHFVHVLQPTPLDVRGRDLTAEEIAEDGKGDTWAQGVHVGYPLLREAGRRLAAEGSVFVDATDVFDGETESPYFDRCHFRERGNQLLAERIAREFLRTAPR
jgi:hypothetical protein